MTIDPDRKLRLEAEYRRTNYVVDDRSVDVTIRLDRDNTALEGLLIKLRANSWAFLTAYNPYSNTVSEDENIARQAELIELLNKQGADFYKARGIGDDWEEPSLFIVEITREAAIDIGRQFEQNAILWGSIEHCPELIWCVDLETQ
jgi:hypothetical protein